MARSNQSTPTIVVNTIAVSSLTPSGISDEVRGRYEAEFGEQPAQPGGWYRLDDWRRTSFVLDHLEPGDRLLDVGSGAGQFANMIAASGKFESVSALDHVRFGKYREYYDSILRFDASIVDLPFDDDHFDVVTCMEVLEHVPDDVFHPGLAELRRVCRRQLVMSVPFQEQEPLSKGHLRRFEPSDIAELFPTGRLTVLDRPRMPWMIIEERRDGSAFSNATSGTAVEVSALRQTADQRRIQQLEAEIERLRSRRSIRLANFAGGVRRGLRRRLGALRPRR